MSDPIHRSPAFQFYADDFLAGTLDLSQEEVGAYIRLLCHQWNRGSIPVETEKQQRLAGGSVSVDVLAKFRLIEGIGLVNDRLEKERAKQAEFRQKQREKGLLSAKARSNQPRFNHGSTVVPTTVPTTVQPSGQPDTQPEGNSPVSSLQSPNNNNTPKPPEGGACVHPDPSPKAQRRRRDPNSIPDGFDGFWSLYPRKVAKGDAIKAWVQMNALTHWSEIKRAIEASIGSESWLSDGGKYIPYPGTWLRARRWEDQLDLPIETKESIAKQMRANRAWDKHPDHANATAEDRIAFAELLVRYKAIS